MKSYFVNLPNSRCQIGKKLNTAIRKYGVRGGPQVPLHVGHNDVQLGRLKINGNISTT
jgi:hypothetical protein